MILPKGFVLTASALALLAGAGWWKQSACVQAGRGPAPSSPAVVSTLAPAAPLQATSPEAGQVLQIAQLLVGARESTALFASRQREVRDRAQRLCQALQARPESWNDVFDLLCCLDGPETALQIAEFLRSAVDASLERRLADVVRMEPHAQARRVALALLDGCKSSDSFVAIQAAADDPDPKIRQSALSGLACRRHEDQATVETILARRARVEPDPILRDTARILLGEKVPPRTPPPPPQRSAFSGMKIGGGSSR